MKKIKYLIFVIVFIIITILYFNINNSDEISSSQSTSKYKTITYGNYLQDVVDDVPVEKPIEWYVLSENRDNAFLMSKDIIISMFFHDHENVKITWENSLLRMWLNDYFFNDAFSDREQENILTTKISNNRTGKYGHSFGNDTNDKVFIMSVDELNKYFKSDIERVAQGNKYVRALGLALYSAKVGDANKVPNTTYYWLRDSGYRKDDILCVDNNGHINEYGFCAKTVGIGARPCIWVKKKALNMD